MGLGSRRIWRSSWRSPLPDEERVSKEAETQPTNEYRRGKERLETSSAIALTLSLSVVQPNKT